MTQFPHLFSPVTFGGITAPNRLLMSAMSINFGVDDEGRVTDQLTEYFVARARGGAGLMLVGGGAVHPTGLELPRLPFLWEDGCIPALSRMVKKVAAYDTRFGVQILHGGRQSYHDQKVAPSAIPAPAVVKGIPRELNLEGIQEMVAAFGDAARRCREAGFDFVEIHAAHGYLINQFLSPNANRREDAYGGSFENRIRFLLEVFGDIRKKAGADFPVGIRMNGNDYIENGWTLEEAIRLAPILEKEGAAYLHVSGGVYGSTELTIPSMYTRHGCFIHLAEAVKPHVTIPVITVGRIKDPFMAERVIAEKKADLVALGRSFLADPDYALKAREGRVKEIRPCMGCCLGCIHQALALEPAGCVVNPDVGREFQLKHLEKAPAPKKVLVVGSGPAGMAAARMAALRGHRVTVIDDGPLPGGAARLGANAPGRGEILDVVNFFVDELSRLGVPIHLNSPLTQECLSALSPECVVLASGSLPDMPMVKGLFQTQMEVMTAVDVMDRRMVAGRRVIVLGGGMVGLVTADHLAEGGREVVVLNRQRHFADEMSSNDRYYLRERLKKGGVKLVKGVSIDRFTDDGVAFRCAEDALTLEGFDTVVLAEKMTPIRKPYELLKNAGVSVHLIGDAKNPRHMMFAISEGEEAGRSI